MDLNISCRQWQNQNSGQEHQEQRHANDATEKRTETLELIKSDETQIIVELNNWIKPVITRLLVLFPNH